MNTVIYITVVAVTDWPRLVWRCVAAVWVWPWRLAAAAAAVPGVPTPAPVSPRPDWTPCRGDLGPSLIRRCALEGILPFDQHLGGGFAGCRCSLSVCSLLISGTDPVEISHRTRQKDHLLVFYSNKWRNAIYWGDSPGIFPRVSQCTWNEAARLLRFEVFTFHRFFCKSNLNMVSIWPDQSESSEDWRARATAKNNSGSIDPNAKYINAYPRLGIDRCDCNKVDTWNIYLDIAFVYRFLGFPN